MTDIRCFWVEDTGRMRVSLRCYYREDAPCAATEYGYHNAMVAVGESPSVRVPSSDGHFHVEAELDERAYDDDPRWPTACARGAPFGAKHRQVFTESIYRAADGREWPLRELPPGAMFDAWWYEGTDMKAGPDGIHLMVCMPPHGGLDHWYVDGSASNGPGWQRTGTVPNVTAHPSILTPRYHGWLRDGVLVSC